MKKASSLPFPITCFLLSIVLGGCADRSFTHKPRHTISIVSAHSSGPAIGRPGGGGGGSGDWISAETRSSWTFVDIPDETGSMGTVRFQEPERLEPLQSEGWSGPSDPFLETGEIDPSAFERGRPPAGVGRHELSDLQPIYFAFDRSDIEDSQLERLNLNAQWIQNNPRASIVLEGHCDERGTPEYNLALSDRRAESVRNHLIRLGIQANRLSTVGYGKELPVDPRHSEEAWALNRRVEFRVISR